MNILTIATITSFAVALLWLVMIYKIDKYKKEPISLIVKVFLGGVVFSFLALFLNTLFEKLFGIFSSLVMVGFIEEGVKFLPVFLIAYKTKHFDEPLDGLFYAGISALGFAFVENILYNYSIINTYHENSTDTLILRGTLPFLHVLLSSFWGYELANYKRYVSSKKRVIFTFLLASILHSAYDILVSIIPIVMPLALIIFSLIFFARVKHLNRISPLNNKYLIRCNKCNSLIKENSLYCQNCGTKIFLYLSYYNIYCPSCQNIVFKSWKYCQTCGVNLKS